MSASTEKPSVQRGKIGQYEVACVTEQSIAYAPARAFFPSMTEEMLQTSQDTLRPGQISQDGLLHMNFQAFVVHSGRYTILVDTCCGNQKDRHPLPMFDRKRTDFMRALAAANVKPEEVDYVMCTHLHWDHVGWNTRLVDGVWKPTFPNARYVMSKVEYEHWDHVYRSGKVDVHTLAFADSVEPVIRAEQALLVQQDFELEQGIWIEPCPGHTPGNFVVNIANDGHQGVMVGDVIHHQVQLLFPELSSRADDDPDLARQTRISLIEKHADTGRLILPAHFPNPSIGSIETSSRGGYGYRPVV